MGKIGILFLICFTALMNSYVFAELPSGVGVHPPGSGKVKQQLSEHGKSAKAQYEKQLAAAQKAVAMSPDNAEAHFILGSNYYTYNFYVKGSMDRAIEEYKKAIELNPQYVQAYSALGSAYLRQGKFDLAKIAWRKGAELKPDSTFFQDRWFDFEYALNRINACQQEVENDASNAKAYYKLGRAHFLLWVEYRVEGQLEKAIAALRQAVTVKPEYLEPYFLLADVYQWQENADEAIETWKQLAALNPELSERASMYMRMGKLYEDQGKIKEAKEVYELAAPLITPQYFFPDREDAFQLDSLPLDSLFWSIYEASGKREEQQWQQAIQRSAQDAEAYLKLGNAYVMQAKTRATLDLEFPSILMQNAREAYEQAIKLQPDFVEAHQALGDFLLRVGIDVLPPESNRTTPEQVWRRLQKALDHYRTASQLDPQNADLHYRFAMACVAVIYRFIFETDASAESVLDEATEEKWIARRVEFLQKAIAINPDHQGAHIQLMNHYLWKEQYHLAWEHMKESQRLGAFIGKWPIQKLRKELELTSSTVTCW